MLVSGRLYTPNNQLFFFIAQLANWWFEALESGYRATPFRKNSPFNKGILGIQSTRDQPKNLPYLILHVLFGYGPLPLAVEFVEG